MAFRAPTPLKSTDLQFGQRVENTAYCNLISKHALPKCKEGERASKDEHDKDDSRQL
jgi:hypothetical protein